MTAFKTLGLLLLATICCGALFAQAPEIDIEIPAGTPISSGSNIDLGDNPDRNLQTTTVRIRNTGTGPLTLTGTPGSYLIPSGAQQVDYTIAQPGSATIAAGTFIDLDIETTPNAKGDWQLVISVPNDDTDESSYGFVLKGKAGKKKDEDCSTNEGSKGGLLLLFGLLSVAVVGLRLQRSRA